MNVWIISYRDKELTSVNGVYGAFSTKEKAIEQVTKYCQIFVETIKAMQSYAGEEEEDNFIVIETDKGTYRIEMFPVDEM